MLRRRSIVQIENDLIDFLCVELTSMSDHLALLQSRLAVPTLNPMKEGTFLLVVLFFSLQNVLLLAQQADQLHPVDLPGVRTFLHLEGLIAAEGTLVL